MSQVAVTCPDCKRSFVINGRGRCRCGSYLIHHIGKGVWKVLDPTDERPVWDLSGTEPRRIQP